jgi:hypothetical protein
MIHRRALICAAFASLAWSQSGVPSLQRIAIEPRAAFIAGPGGRHHFLVSGYYSDGSVRDLTREAAYSVSEPGS